MPNPLTFTFQARVCPSPLPEIKLPFCFAQAIPGSLSPPGPNGKQTFLSAFRSHAVLHSDLTGLMGFVQGGLKANRLLLAVRS